VKIGIFKLRAKILKVACYQNYCIDSNELLQNNEDHRVLIVVGPNRRPTNRRWGTAAILKTVQSRYLRKRFTSLDEIWYNDANGSRRADQLLKFRFFEPKMMGAAILKEQNCSISGTV